MILQIMNNFSWNEFYTKRNVLIVTAVIEQQGLDPLMKILEKLGGWPVLEGDDWNESEFNWTDSVYRFRKMGYSVDYFIDFSIGVDLKNSTKRIIDVRRKR